MSADLEGLTKAGKVEQGEGKLVKEGERNRGGEPAGGGGSSGNGVQDPIPSNSFHFPHPFSPRRPVEGFEAYEGERKFKYFTFKAPSARYCNHLLCCGEGEEDKINLYEHFLTMSLDSPKLLTKYFHYKKL